MNYANQMNDQGTVTPRGVSAALNKFFRKHPEMAEGCIIRNEWDGCRCMLIIESSQLYYELNGYASNWDAHTDFYEAFEGSGWFPEPINSCQVGFYKD